MRVVAWLSALMICTAFYASVRMERMVKSGTPERATELRQEAIDLVFLKSSELMGK
jgi:hypothetical protein